MKYTILLFFMTIFSSIMAQDTTCQKLFALSSKPYSDKKIAVRCITKTPSNDIETTILQDTFQNFSSVNQINMGGFKKKVETVIYNNKGYSRMDDGKWQTVDISAYNMMNSYLPTLNIQNQPYKNCKQLSDEKIGEQICLVFETEMDKDFQMSNQMMNVKSHIKFWITPEGLVQKMTNEMNQNNVIILLESKFEYDNNIKIVEPIR